FKGTFSKFNDDEIALDGHLSAKVILRCVKCLDEFEEEISVDIIETYYPAGKVEEATNEDGFNDLTRFVYNNAIIDLSDIVRDNLVAALPAYPVCPKCRAQGK
ncbi:MAG: YceD family protein, partial [Caldisericaceae bacterium]